MIPIPLVVLDFYGSGSGPAKTSDAGGGQKAELSIVVNDECEQLHNSVLCTLQTTHARVCSRAGRAVAPQLRRLVPAWLAAQFDPYAPAAAAARDSLANTFPENKLPEVLSFCKTELMTTIWDNLFANTEVSMTKKNEEVGSGGVDAEAERGRRERALCGALRSLCCVCALWGAGTAGDWLTTQLAALFDSPAFWKLAANPALSVKSYRKITKYAQENKFKRSRTNDDGRTRSMQAPRPRSAPFALSLLSIGTQFPEINRLSNRMMKPRLLGAR
ncbi:E3 ubiquitin-protein ligase listerin [Eumeta japonica]|uniref:E3 ubiquitin-protein ligase listerin n=1 Tax=Eumeta variegata TaxID=151549 RepID=A0A4C2AF84_EUMVA|nr:E3 ubiquitin-protein ligase listerin [Eumeta japonica]